MKIIICIVSIISLVLSVSVFAGNKQMEAAKTYFKGDQEKTTRDAIWGSGTDFRVGVINDGSNRDGYARYVCSVLKDDFGFNDKRLHVGVYDIAKLTYKKKWVRIGRHYCSDK